jgi:hypothetical protein
MPKACDLKKGNVVALEIHVPGMIAHGFSGLFAGTSMA